MPFSKWTESSAIVATVRDYGGTILIAVAVALFIRFFFIEAYRIPSSAMRPALEPGDTIFVSKWPFGLRVPGIDEALTAGRKPKRGEVVVFSLQDETHRDYIKRVVAIEGDTVQLKTGHLYINNQPTEIPNSQKANCASEKIADGTIYPICYESPTIEDFGPEKVPVGSVFLLGDLRTKTPREPGSDLPIKSWGIQPLNALRGSALWIWLSVEPQTPRSSGGFPSFRFDRMFRRVL